MATTTTQPKAIAPSKFESQLSQMDQGVVKYLPATVSLTLEGTPTKQPAIDTSLKGWLTTFAAVETARQAYQDAVKARLAITVEARTFYKALKLALKQYFGSQSATLANFGIAPDKAATQSTKTKMVAAAKREQTRKVRGTTSKKAKEAITVVGNPPISISSSGTVVSAPPPVNLPATSNTPASSAASSPLATPSVAVNSAPAGSGSGNGTPGSGTPAA
jgi:hypothetical protein